MAGEFTTQVDKNRSDQNSNNKIPIKSIKNVKKHFLNEYIVDDLRMMATADCEGMKQKTHCKSHLQSIK